MRIPRSHRTVAAVTAAAIALAFTGRGAGPSLEERLREHVRYLGSDAQEGRFPGTPGGNRTVAYLAAKLREAGVRPLGGGGSYFQWVPLVEVEPEGGSRLVLRGPEEEMELTLGEDYLLTAGGPESWVAAPTPLIFVGYGIIAPEYDHNDYQGLDVRGKIAVALEGEPASVDKDFFAGDEPTAYSAFETKRRTALSRGAAGIVVLTGISGGGELRWKRLRREYAWPGITLAYGVPEDLAIYLAPAMSRLLLRAGPHTPKWVASMARRGTLHSFPMGVTLEFHGRFRLRHFRAANVVGRIPGSDPRLASENVVVSAHWDHLGRGPAVGGDAIYNGVVDNAMGTAGVLEIARSLAAIPGRRPVIVLLSTGEEEGLLGSGFFLHHPPVPLISLVADVNVDGLAFMDTFRDVIAVGGARSSLGATLRRVAHGRGLRVAPAPPGMAAAESFVRSDQEVFAQQGVPSILINEGLHWDHASPGAALRRELVWLATVYHTPKDDLEQPLNFKAAAEHCRLIEALVREIADAGEAPHWRSGSRWEYRQLMNRAKGR